MERADDRAGDRHRPASARPNDGVIQVPLAQLRGDLSPRHGDLDEDHVRLLVQAGDRVPPILVLHPDLLVIDGAHRVRAAIRLGRVTIAARWFRGTRAEAEIEAVRANVRHGKPLSFAEREEAALRRLATSPELSDRAIAHDTGLDHKTVAKLRRRTGADTPPPPVRTGLDGRVRRVLDPQRSLARDAGRTVHSCADPGPDAAPHGWWSTDLAVSGAVPELCAWLDASAPGSLDIIAIIQRVPLSRLHLVVDELRARQAVLEHFIALAEMRVRTAGRASGAEREP